MGMIGSPMIAAVLTTLWEGDFRKTIQHDSQVIFHYLDRRWHGVSAVSPDAAAESEPENKPEAAAAPEEREASENQPSGDASKKQ